MSLVRGRKNNEPTARNFCWKIFIFLRRSQVELKKNEESSFFFSFSGRVDALANEISLKHRNRTYVKRICQGAHPFVDQQMNAPLIDLFNRTSN